jgi:transposase
MPLASSGPVRVLGLDDWAWKKGQTYGTILVDLEKHQVIELLPDRSPKTVERWLRTHPEIEIVSRDRGGDYAAAARKGAPQAQQVADRFHLVKNLREAIRDLMERKQSCLPEASEDQRADGVPSQAQGRAKGIKVLEVEPEAGQEKRYRIMSPYLRQSARQITYEAVRTQVRRDNRLARYQAVRLLHRASLQSAGNRAASSDQSTNGSSVRPR